MIYLELTKDKRQIIKILSDPKIYEECYGLAYTPKARVHIAFQNYLIKYEDKILGLLQLDKFTDCCPSIHGCILPEYRKEIIYKTIKEVFFEHAKQFFPKVIATVPKTATHVIKFLTFLGCKEEGIISNSIEYGGDITDCLILSHSFEVK